MANTQATRGARTGGRSSVVRAKVLAAAVDELVDGGYAALTVDGVAARAGVNKTTVYRRWPSLDDLLLDALTDWSQNALPVPDTGSIDTDLRALGRELADVLNAGVGRQIAALVLTAGLRSDALATETRRYFDHQARRAVPTVEKAVARGELPPNCDVTKMLNAFRAPLFYRMITTGDAIDEDVIDHSVDVTLHAARAGLLST